MATSTSAPRSGVAAQPPRSRPAPPSMPLQQLNQNTAAAIQGGGENNSSLESAFSKQVSTLSSLVATLQKEAEQAAFEAASMRELVSAKCKEASSASALNSELRGKLVMIAKEVAADAEALAKATEAAAAVEDKIASCDHKVAQADDAVATAVERACKAEEEAERARNEMAALRRELQVSTAVVAEAQAQARSESQLRLAAERKLEEEQKKFNATMASFGVGGGAFGGFGGFGRG